MGAPKATKAAADFSADDLCATDLAWRQIDPIATAKTANRQRAERRLIGARVFAEISSSAAPADPEALVRALLARGVTVARVVKAVAP